MKPGKKKPSPSRVMVLADSQPWGIDSFSPSRSMKAIFPVSLTPMIPFSHRSSSDSDMQCTKEPKYNVFSGDIFMVDVSGKEPGARGEKEPNEIERTLE